MNVNKVLTNAYEEKTLGEHEKNEPKTNPNEPNLLNAQMNVNKVLTKDYENKSNWALYENEPKTNPNKANIMPKQTQSEPTQTQFYLPLRHDPIRQSAADECQRVSSSNSLLLSDCLSFCRASSSICRTLSFVRPRSSPICIKVFFFFLIGEPVRPK